MKRADVLSFEESCVSRVFLFCDVGLGLNKKSSRPKTRSSHKAKATEITVTATCRISTCTYKDSFEDCQSFIWS